MFRKETFYKEKKACRVYFSYHIVKCAPFAYNCDTLVLVFVFCEGLEFLTWNMGHVVDHIGPVMCKKFIFHNM